MHPIFALAQQMADEIVGMQALGDDYDGIFRFVVEPTE
jgi:hypothetical protein